MMHDPSSVILVAAVVAALAGAVAFFAWRRHGAVVATLRTECDRLQALSEARERWFKEANDRAEHAGIQLAGAMEGLARSKTQIDQLRDLIKVHVARRREFEEWANPIKAHLGEGIGHVLHNLKENVARHEFALRRQERIVAEAQDQYRAKRDELERMRRELTLKNYHIAALNERFIRIEERLQELGADMGAVGGEPMRRLAAAPEITAVQEDVAASAKRTPDTDVLLADDAKSKDWMGVLEDWHRQLQDRFERLEELQSRIRGPAGGAAPPEVPRADRIGSNG